MKYGLIGERLGHSFSQYIHTKLFDYDYELTEIPPDDLHAFMTARDFCAINVTIPYKQAVIPYLDEISDVARHIGAVNTVVNRGGKLYGDNTDFGGMVALLKKANITLADKNVLILGSGGTSKTALAVAHAERCARVHRVSRTGEDGCITYEQAAACADTHIIINTTPCGMYPHIGESAVDIGAFPRLQGVVDVVYNPLRSKLVCDARERGIAAAGGLYMLVAQAVLAAEIFTGQSVDPERIDEQYAHLLREKQNVVLVGMPGCGKTTVGKRLAKRLGFAFVDTDEEIVKRESCAIPELFDAIGEQGFREVEAEVVRAVAARQGAVIATGGGAVLRKDNVSLLKENGRVYFLDRPLEQLAATADRPLSRDRTALKQRYRERYGIYRACCDCHITATATPDAAATCIEEEFIRETLGN